MFEIGTTLRQARDRRRLTFDQVEAETKIRTRYLRALEDEQFDILPGPTYVKGFLRTYAEYLNLDGQLFVDEFNSRYFDPFVDPERGSLRRSSLPQTTRSRRNESRSVVITVVALSIVGLLVFMGLKLPDDSATPGLPAAPTGSASASGNPALTAKSAIPGMASTATTSRARQRPVTITLAASGGDTYVAIWRGSHDSEAKRTRIFRGTLLDGDPPQKFTSTIGFTLSFGKPEVARLVVGKTAVAVSTTKPSIDISPKGAVGG